MTSPISGAGAGLAPEPGPAPDPELIAPLVQACPAVAGLAGGPFGEVATYLPGRRVRGVRVTEGAIEIHVVGRYPASVAEIAAQVRIALAAVTGLPVDVAIDDLVLPGDPDPADAVERDADRRPTTTTSRPSAGSESSTHRSGAPAFPPSPAEPSAVGASAARPPAAGLEPKEHL